MEKEDLWDAAVRCDSPPWATGPSRQPQGRYTTAASVLPISVLGRSSYWRYEAASASNELHGSQAVVWFRLQDGISPRDEESSPSKGDEGEGLANMLEYLEGHQACVTLLVIH